MTESQMMRQNAIHEINSFLKTCKTDEILYARHVTETTVERIRDFKKFEENKKSLKVIK